MGSFTQLSYHVVFATKYRKPMITDAIRQDLYEYMGGILKANSAKWCNDKKDRQHKFEWQKGYGAFSVSYSRIEVARLSIQNQEQHHREKSFQEEYEDFRTRHGIRYRTEYLFEDEHRG